MCLIYLIFNQSQIFMGHEYSGIYNDQGFVTRAVSDK